MKNKKPTTASDPQETETNPTDELVSAAIEKLLLPPLCDDISAQDSINSLTESDLAALVALGTSSELVSNVMQRIRSQEHQSRQADTPTYLTGQGETETVSFDQGSGIAPAGDFVKFLDDQVDFGHTGIVKWTSSYLKKRVLGRGGQGVVYLTENLDEFRWEQALKTFSAEPYGNVKTYREDMQRMGRVASAVKRIHHDNLLAVERFMDHSGSYVMIMQLVDGFDLRCLLQPELVGKLQSSVDKARWEYLIDVVYTISKTGRWCLKPGIAVYIIEKCLRGLGSLHNNGIVHADVKLSNIMLDCNSSIKLIDIGSAFELDSRPATQTWSPLYAPPEFFENGQWTPQSDMACLGYVLIELLTGQPAVNVDVGCQSTRSVNIDRHKILWQAKMDLPGRLNEILPETVLKSSQLMSLVQDLIAPDPQERFPSASEAVDGKHGTRQFHRQLTLGDLDAFYANEIQGWIENVKKVEQ